MESHIEAEKDSEELIDPHTIARACAHANTDTQAFRVFYRAKIRSRSLGSRIGGVLLKRTLSPQGRGVRAAETPRGVYGFLSVRVTKNVLISSLRPPRVGLVLIEEINNLFEGMVSLGQSSRDVIQGKPKPRRTL